MITNSLSANLESNYKQMAESIGNPPVAPITKSYCKILYETSCKIFEIVALSLFSSTLLTVGVGILFGATFALNAYPWFTIIFEIGYVYSDIIENNFALFVDNL